MSTNLANFPKKYYALTQDVWKQPSGCDHAIEYGSNAKGHKKPRPFAGDSSRDLGSEGRKRAQMISVISHWNHPLIIENSKILGIHSQHQEKFGTCHSAGASDWGPARLEQKQVVVHPMCGV